MCLLSDLRAEQWLLEWTQIPDVWECGLLQIDVHFPGVQVSNCPVHESKISVFKRKASWVQVYYLHHGSIWGKFRNFKSFHLIAYPCNSWMAFWSFFILWSRECRRQNVGLQSCKGLNFKIGSQLPYLGRIDFSNSQFLCLSNKNTIYISQISFEWLH